MNPLIYFAFINVISSSIIPIPFEYINGKLTIQFQQSKSIITCSMSTAIKKNFIPKNYNKNSKTKRFYKDESLGFFDSLEGKKPVSLYDDWFFINNNEFIMKYNVDPNVRECIISLSIDQPNDESLINILYSNNKISNRGFGITFDEKNKNKGILYLGGLPEEEKKGLYSFSFKHSLITNSLEGKNWNLFMEKASIINKENTFSKLLFYNGFIKIEKEDFVLVPPKFYRFLYEHIFGFYVKEKSCDLEYNNLVCDCKNINNINSFKSINFYFEELLIEFNVEDSFIKENDKCYFIFKQHEEDYFIFGTKFMKKYKIEFLNYKQINIYSKKEFKIDKRPFRRMIIINILKLVFKYKYSFLIGIIFIIIYSCSGKQEEKVKYY